MTDHNRTRDRGVVLINVLVILSIAAIVVFLMLRSQEISLSRAQLQSATSAADALVRGAEASAISALRRDLAAASETDHYGEAWAAIAQEDVSLSIGRFSVQLVDAQSRMNLSRLREGALGEVEILLRLLAELNLPRGTAERIAAEVIARPGLTRLTDLRATSASTIAAITPFVDFLGSDRTLNLNTADPVLLRAAFNNRSAASRLVQRRESRGFLTPEDLTQVGAVRPPSAGFTSDTFDMEAVAEVDGIALRLNSRILRGQSGAGPFVRVVRRQYGVPLSGISPVPAK